MGPKGNMQLEPRTVDSGASEVSPLSSFPSAFLEICADTPKVSDTPPNS